MDNREKLVTVRMTPTERRLLEVLAEHNGESLGGILRRTAMPVVRRLARALDRERREESAASAA